MSVRKFSNFLDAYLPYADDRFVPPQFNEWAALSVVAGALERRVWLPWNDTFSFYPNIYVLCVSKPGVGKSVALNKAVDLLREMNRKAMTLNIMPTQVTEAKFIELMGHGRSFVDRSIAGKEFTVFQNSGYFFASEASNSLRNIFGEFIACLTDFYDCPEFWERATKKDGKKIVLKNVCMNILAGSTFDYLGKLVSDENIQGGFASRLLYVVHSDKMIRDQKFQSGTNVEDAALRKEYRAALVHDLGLINQMTGPMHADAEFGAAWEEWYPRSEKVRQEYESEKLQSILARTNTNVLKVSMLLSAAESGDRMLRLRHWHKAVELVEKVNSHIPEIFMQAKANQAPGRGGNGLTAAIILALRGQQNPTQESVRSRLVIAGHASHLIDSTIQAMLNQGALRTGSAVAGHGVTLIVNGNANDHF